LHSLKRFSNRDRAHSSVGDEKIDDFLRRALVTVGGEELLSNIEHITEKLKIQQESIFAEHEELRNLDKTDPKFKYEIFRIDKNYKPHKVKEILCHCEDSFLCLPENLPYSSNEELICVMRDVVTNKVMEADLDEQIRDWKEADKLEKSRSIFSLNEMMRMEMGLDDPDMYT